MKIYDEYQKFRLALLAAWKENRHEYFEALARQDYAEKKRRIDFDIQIIRCGKALKEYEQLFVLLDLGAVKELSNDDKEVEQTGEA